MALEYFELKNARKNHPAWRLLTAENGPFIAAFLDKQFRESNSRGLSESELILQLEDFIYALADEGAVQEFPRGAADYLNEWADNSRGWLRKYYPPDNDEPHYDLTPATERALRWMEELFERRDFVGTESRLAAGFDLLRQIVRGVEQDKKKRIEQLKDQKRELSRQIRAIEEGEMPTLNRREVRERFSLFRRTARELLGDFREVEQNFRELDRSIRERIAAWTGEKGAFLDSFFAEQEGIESSDQGQSFQAFWDFLMSSQSQEELTDLLDRVFEIDELKDLTEDRSLKRIHFDWINAGERTQRMVARLSRQLRRFLDDKSLYESRRISELLDRIDRRALALKESLPPAAGFMDMAESRPGLSLPLERPLFSPPLASLIDSLIQSGEEEDIDSSALYNQFTVDTERLERRIRDELGEATQVSLGSLLERYPLEQGLAELIAYFDLADKSSFALVDGEAREAVEWTDREGRLRTAKIPRIVYQRRINEDA